MAIKRYVISFWNGVDLRYKLLQGPSVKISIAGIIISRVRTRTDTAMKTRLECQNNTTCGTPVDVLAILNRFIL